MFETIKFDSTFTEYNANFTVDHELTIGDYPNRAVFYIGSFNNASVTISNLTFASLPMTTAVLRSSNNMTVIIAYLVNPPVGTSRIFGNISNTVPHISTSISFYNVNTENPLYATRDVGVSSGAYTGPIAVPENGLFLDSISPDAQQVISPTAGQTLVARHNGTFGSGGVSYRIFTDANPSYVASWDNSTFQNTTVYAEAVFNPAPLRGGSFLFNLL
jgi:hypothetical protein